MIGSHELLAKIQAAADESDGGGVLVFVDGDNAPMLEYNRIEAYALNDEGTNFVTLRIYRTLPAVAGAG